MTSDPKRSTALDPTRRTALVTGIFYLLTFVSSIPAAAIFLPPIIDDPNYVLGAGADSQVVLGAILDIVNALTAIGSAVAVFSIVRREHEGLALGFVTTRLMEAAIVSIGVISLLAVVTLRQEGVAATDPGSALVAGRALVALRDWTFLLGPGLMPALNVLMFGTLLYRARLIPRAIPALGLIGAPLQIAFVIGTMFGITGPGTAVHAIATIPFFFWELFAGLWMTFKGFDRSAPIVAAAIEEAGRSTASPVTTSPVAVATKAGAA